jgi:hypothetical protein
MKNQLKRAWRIFSFTAGAGILGLGAGNVFGMTALQSAGFGAVLAVLGLGATLFLVHAAKGRVTDKDFDTAINSAIETVKSRTQDEK